MRLYLYAIAEGLGSVGDVTGIQREALNLITIGNAIVVAGSVSGLPAVSRENLIAQDSLVRTLHARADALLPMRFGSSAGDVEALIRLLDPLAARVAECCALVRGREQMTVRVLRTSTEGASSAFRASGALGAGAEGAKGAIGAKSASGALSGDSAGARYLAERAASRTPPGVAPLVAALRDVHRATRVEPGRHDDVLATVYHLIDRGSSDRFRQQVESAAATMPHLILHVSGPMPAYAFAVLSAL